ncbi:MAG TPA: hypothetical protein DC049_13845 [Spirochaetia bacterium]|nr:hypothetical protein [Spirochaetia bacterium]
MYIYKFIVFIIKMKYNILMNCFMTVPALSLILCLFSSILLITEKRKNSRYWLSIIFSLLIFSWSALIFFSAFPYFLSARFLASRLQALVYLAAGPVFLHFTGTYPGYTGKIPKQVFFLIYAALVPAVIGSPLFISNLVFSAGGGTEEIRGILFLPVLLTVMILPLCAGSVSLLLAAVTEKNQDRKKAMRILSAGVLTAVVLGAILDILPGFWGLRRSELLSCLGVLTGFALYFSEKLYYRSADLLRALSWNLIEKINIPVLAYTRGRISYFNNSARILFSFTEDNLPVEIKKIFPSLPEKNLPEYGQFELAGPEKIQYLEYHSYPGSGAGGAEGLLIINDVSDKHRFQEQRLQSETRYRRLFTNMNSGLIIIAEHKTDEKTGYIIKEANSSFRKITGAAHPEGSDYFSFFLLADPQAEYWRNVFQQISEKRNFTAEYYFSSINKWIYCSAFAPEAGQIAMIFEDISERKKNEEKLTWLASYDPLTGLYNRKSFYEKITDCLSVKNQRRRPRNFSLALLIIDIDRFKEINDELGHSGGDIMLVECSRRIKNCLRESDMLFRMAGDEFAVIIHETTDDLDLGIVAERILSALNSPFNISDHEFSVTASIGISIYPKDGTLKETLENNADTALNEAQKKSNAYCFFREEMNERMLYKIFIRNSLQASLEAGELSLVYQPIVSLDGKIQGAEALLRWHHPLRGDIAPSIFIGIAEETGLIKKIGDFILRIILKQINEWTRKGVNPLPVNVNISPRQFNDPTFAPYIIELFKNAGVSPQRVMLEITENCLFDAIDESIVKMNTLIAAGFSFSIDDFGTGYSTFQRLNDLPMQVLKIDKSFTHDIVNSPERALLLRGIISMAHIINLTVVAEGVETTEQYEMLKSFHCDKIQGFYFYPPLLPDQYESLLSLS